MEQSQTEQQAIEATETSTEKELQKQSLAMTPEEKVTKIATEITNAYFKDNPQVPEERPLILERTKRQVEHERNQLISVLSEGEKELATLSWNSIQAKTLSQISEVRINAKRKVKTIGGVKGFRGLFILVFGNFALTKNGGWIYRPTNDQMRNEVQRWIKKKPCELFAQKMRNEMYTYENRTPIVKIESEKFKQLKKDLADQLKEMKENL